MTFKYIIFDLDNTLYPRSSGVMQEIGRRIQQWLQREFDLTWEEASAMRRNYFLQYGTTLAGLMAQHDVDMDDYLFFVHDIPVEKYLNPSLALDQMLQVIPLRKVIYTNATSAYARRVVRALGVVDHFEQIIGVKEVGLRSKADRRAYERVLELIDAQGPECIMVEDTAHNLKQAKALGMMTVLVEAEVNEHADLMIRSVLKLAQVVGGLEEKV